MKHCYREAIVQHGYFVCHCTTTIGRSKCVNEMKKRDDCTRIGFSPIISEGELALICLRTNSRQDGHEICIDDSYKAGLFELQTTSGVHITWGYSVEDVKAKVDAYSPLYSEIKVFQHIGSFVKEKSPMKWVRRKP